MGRGRTAAFDLAQVELDEEAGNDEQQHRDPDGRSQASHGRRRVAGLPGGRLHRAPAVYATSRPRWRARVAPRPGSTRAARSPPRRTHSRRAPSRGSRREWRQIVGHAGAVDARAFRADRRPAPVIQRPRPDFKALKLRRFRSNSFGPAIFPDLRQHRSGRPRVVSAAGARRRGASGSRQAPRRLRALAHGQSLRHRVFWPIWQA